ncbi:MAG: GNAT family N-acetyltransferase [archaeon]|nr:GNAT family N-acetyltransferase [archaeon]
MPKKSTNGYVIAGKSLFWKKNSGTIRRHLCNWALSPDSLGQYAKKTNRWRNVVRKIPERMWRVFDPVLLLGLRATRRNALLLEENGRIVSHVIFQRHGKSLHVFSVWVDSNQRGKGIALKSVKRFIEYARNVRGIKSVRIGGGNDRAVNRICRTVAKDDKTLHYREGNWLDFLKT